MCHSGPDCTAWVIYRTTSSNVAFQGVYFFLERRRYFAVWEFRLFRKNAAPRTIPSTPVTCLVIYKNCFASHASLLAQLEFRVNSVLGNVFSHKLGVTLYFLAYDSVSDARLVSRVTNQILRHAFPTLFFIQATLIGLALEKTLSDSCSRIKFFFDPYQTHAVSSRYRFAQAHVRGQRYASSEF